MRIRIAWAAKNEIGHEGEKRTRWGNGKIFSSDYLKGFLYTDDSKSPIEKLRLGLTCIQLH